MNVKKMMALAMTICVMVLLSAGCGGNKMEVPTAAPGEVMLWSSGERPTWTLNAPETKEGKLFFVGRTGTLATEQLAMNRARMDANNNIAQYMGTLVKNKIEQARVDFGLSSDVINPTESAREYTHQLATGYLTKVKQVDTYLERWQMETGIGFRAWGLYAVPLEALEAEHGQAAAAMAADAARKAKERNDQVAKQQLEKASDMWKKMEQEGLFKD